MAGHPQLADGVNFIEGAQGVGPHVPIEFHETIVDIAVVWHEIVGRLIDVSVGDPVARGRRPAKHQIALAVGPPRDESERLRLIEKSPPLFRAPNGRGEREPRIDRCSPGEAAFLARLSLFHPLGILIVGRGG